MKRKKIVIGIGLIILFCCCLFYIKSRDNNYVSLEKQDEKRIESINKYDARKNNVGSSTNEIPEGTYNGVGIVLTNRAEFIKNFKNKDVGIAISNNLIPSSLQYLNYIIADCKEGDIENYFNANKKTIFNVFGIDNLTDFTNLYENVKQLGEIQKIKIDTSSMEVISNVADFIVNVEGTENSTTIKVEARVSNTSTLNTTFYLK